MCGSRPLAEAVTRSTGTGGRVAGIGGAQRRDARRVTASTSAGFVGRGSSRSRRRRCTAIGAVADGRPQKYLGSANGWPISAEPTTLPSRSIRLPFACAGRARCAISR